MLGLTVFEVKRTTKINKPIIKKEADCQHLARKLVYSGLCLSYIICGKKKSFQTSQKKSGGDNASTYIMYASVCVK